MVRRSAVTAGLLLVAGAALSACVVRGFYFSSCTTDGQCKKTEYSIDEGVKNFHSERGAMVEDTTIEELSTSSTYRLSVNYDHAIVQNIPHKEAVAYLQRAAMVTSQPYRLCDYSPAFVNIEGHPPIPYSQLKIVPAHAQLNGSDHYLILVKHFFGPFSKGDVCMVYQKVVPSGTGVSSLTHEMATIVEALVSLGAHPE